MLRSPLVQSTLNHDEPERMPESETALEKQRLGLEIKSNEVQPSNYIHYINVLMQNEDVNL